MDVMIEVKLSEEEAKAGAAPDEIGALAEAIRDLPNLRLLGLMTMPPWSDDAEKSRPYFARLRELAARTQAGAALDGDVARLGSGHRGRRDYGPRGYGAVRSAEKRVKLGFFSPLPPARTGVADYSAALLAALQPLGRVEVNARNADVALYHLGNNQLHREIYKRALEEPGVVVLHDAVLHHFLLGTLSEREYIAEFIYNYGGWSEDLARELWRAAGALGGGSGDTFDIRCSSAWRSGRCALIVHNPRAGGDGSEPRAGRADLRNPALVQRARRAAGRIRRDPVAGSAGRPRKHVSIRGIRAFARVEAIGERAAGLRACAARRREMALLVAGDFVSSDLERAARAAAPTPPGCTARGVHRRSANSGAMPQLSDACINLRYPAAGETSGISIRLMGIGKPVMMSNGLETSRFPDPACIRVDRACWKRKCWANTCSGWRDSRRMPG